MRGTALSYFAGPDRMTKGQGYLISSVLHRWSLLGGHSLHVSSSLGQSLTPTPSQHLNVSFTTLTACIFVNFFFIWAHFTNAMYPFHGCLLCRAVRFRAGIGSVSVTAGTPGWSMPGICRVGCAQWCCMSCVRAHVDGGRHKPGSAAPG